MPSRSGKSIRNPPLVAMVLGLIFGLLNLTLPRGVDVFLHQLGATASPVLLFALGVILSQPQENSRPMLPATMMVMKFVVHPLLAFGIFVGVSGLALQEMKPAMMVAAAPCGVMSFMLAMNYNVRVDAIARVIFITSIGSLLTLTLAAGL